MMAGQRVGKADPGTGKTEKRQEEGVPRIAELPQATENGAGKMGVVGSAPVMAETETETGACKIAGVTGVARITPCPYPCGD